MSLAVNDIDHTDIDEYFAAVLLQVCIHQPQNYRPSPSPSITVIMINHISAQY